MRVRLGWISLLALAFWCGLIFGTSSTVIRPQAFFGWIAVHVLTDATSFQRFTMFWGYSWFAIVKGWHATEYAILFTITRAAIDRWAASRTWRNTAVSLGFTILFAMSDEYHQTFVPGRGGNWIDVGIDTLGAGLAAFVLHGRRQRASADDLNQSHPQPPPELLR
jgi:hypothetical protein